MAILKKYTEIKGTNEVLYVARIPKGMADALDGVIEAFAPGFAATDLLDKPVADQLVPKATCPAKARKAVEVKQG